jgi:hypothetical protein
MKTPPRSRTSWLSQGAGALALLLATTHAQTTDPNKPWPFAPRATPVPGAAATPGPAQAIPGMATPVATPRPFGAAAAPEQGPRDVPLMEKKWDELVNKEVGKYGATALEIEKDKWKHAETENFILHYRRATEAQKVAREVEYDLWFVAKVLGAGRDRYQRKSHVFVFEDEDEWKKFVGLTKAPPWAASFAYGDELFLNVRRTEGPKRFDSNTLAHEATHAVVARLFPQKRWPLWLNEGWAEYMGGASVAARKGQSVKGHQSRLRLAGMPLATLEALREYPSDEAAVGQLYQTSEKLVRFLMDGLPQDRILKFIDAALAGKPLRECVLGVYGDKIKDWPDFEKKFEKFGR